METTERTKEAKYMEGYLELKEASKWVNYWVVIRGFQLFFYKNSNTHINENIQFHLDLGTKSNFVSGKNSKNKFEFEVKVERNKKYLFRANTEADRLQWVYTLGLAAQGKLPQTSFASDPDPGDELYNNKKTVTKTTSNQYSEVPNFHVSSDAAGVTDEEMQKKIMSLKKANSFSSYCKNLVGRKDKRNTNKTVDSEESGQPEPVQTEAEAYYDPFPGSKPPWYFGKLTRENAEKILEEHPAGSYLVRDSETVNKPGAYTISLRHREKFRHHKLETLPDGNLIIKTCEQDKVFPNLAMLMDYFTKSQEREIQMTPVNCKDQVDNGVIQPDGFDPNDPRPPIPGCEDTSSRPERSSSYASPGASAKHSYENLPDKPKAKPPLRSRVTSPDLCRTHGYENVPNKDKRSMSDRTPPPGLPADYEVMSDKGAPAPPPALPPRCTPSKSNGYENLPSKGAELLPSDEGYVNLPARQDRPTSNGPPPLPPKTPSQGLQGYENVPRRDGSSIRTRNPPYENTGVNGRQRYSHGNMVPNSSAGRQPAQFKRSATVPAHIIQNTLENVTHSIDRL